MLSARRRTCTHSFGMRTGPAGEHELTAFLVLLGQRERTIKIAVAAPADWHAELRLHNAKRRLERVTDFGKEQACAVRAELASRPPRHGDARAETAAWTVARGRRAVCLAPQPLVKSRRASNVASRSGPTTRARRWPRRHTVLTRLDAGRHALADQLDFAERDDFATCSCPAARQAGREKS